ncbi:MAG: SusC/RagA family TonB-linked outer membrane protein, partial [Tannerellaceae bacterium]|nr:SusC/RagA family TonB-linked outer membrane protein [Tannerellaceae bacterium]
MLLFTLWGGIQGMSFANELSKSVTIQFSDLTLDEAILQIEKATGYSFFYDENTIDLSSRVSLDVKNLEVNDAMRTMLKSTNLTFKLIHNQIVLYPKNSRQPSLPEGMEAKQQQRRTIKGLVKDTYGEPVIGANVVVKGSTQGTVTNMEGAFSLEVPDNAVLQISYIGYLNQEVTVGRNTSLQIILKENSQALSEVVVVGYGIQSKVTLTGAISAIKGDDVISTKNENVQNMLTGKIPGVRVTQKTSEPGDFNNNFDIRGMGTPLVVIDGIPRAADALQRMEPNDIESITVLKDASAAIYGVRAANGVVIVTTKKGESGKVELNYSGSFSAQVPSGLPSTLGAIDYMTLRNERSMHNLNGGSLIFDDSRFDPYLTGEKQSTDWYSLVFSAFAPETQHSLSATGGNDRISYYIGLGYLYQEGFFKSGDLNYNKYNVRSNISGKITDRLTVDLNLNLVMDEQNRPYQDSWWIIRGFWRQNSLMPAYADPEQTMLYHGLIEGDNPVSFMDKEVVGYKKYNKKWVETAGSLKYDIPGIEGLYAKGTFSYDYYVSSANLFNKAYDQYRYDEASSTYAKYTRQSPNSIERQTYMKTHLLAQVSLNYSQTFALTHKVSGFLGWETNRYDSDNFFAKRNLALPLEYLFAGVAAEQLATMNSASDALYINSNNALIGRVNYAYADKYLAEVLFRYDGSSKFAPDYQWGFFPSASVGWRISEENFFKESALSFIQQLKLRASYGVTGDDSASSYQFISGYNYPSGTDRRNFTGGYVFDGNFVASADNKGIPNPLITWYKAKMFNVGVDIDAWNGLFGITLEYFNRDREGLLATRSGGIPTVVGASL